MSKHLTVPNDYVSETHNKIAGISFYFERGFDGEGLWFQSESIAQIPANTAAPMIIQSDLSAIANTNGLSETYGFSRYIPAPVKAVRAPKADKALGRKSKRRDGLFSHFNPFANATV